MSDLISRQYAIKRFGEDGTWLERQGVTTLSLVEAKQRAVDLLESFPSADRPTMDREYLIDLIQEAVYDGEACAKLIDLVDRPTGEWIPVSERLPKVGEDVLFSIDTMYVSEGCLRDDGDWWQFRWNSVQPKKYVIAWMPLPEPYREDGEEE